MPPVHGSERHGPGCPLFPERFSRASRGPFFGGLGISSLPGGVFGASSGEDGGSDAGGSDDDVRDRRVHYEVCDDHVLLGCVGSDFELYVALDPLTRRSAAVASEKPMVNATGAHNFRDPCSMLSIV